MNADRYFGLHIASAVEAGILEPTLKWNVHKVFCSGSQLLLNMSVTHY